MTSVVNVRHERYDVYIGRPSIYGNPYKMGNNSDNERDACLMLYRMHLEQHPEIVDRARRELTGKVLGCHCKPKACHGDILVEFMERVA